MSRIPKLLKLNGKFGKDENGSATIESVLWMPIFILIFSLIADASLLFHAQANLTRIVQDANRNYSIGRLDTNAETEAYVLARLGNAAGDPDTTIDTTVSLGVITTRVSVPAYNFVATGFFTSLMSIDLSVTAQHLMES